MRLISREGLHSHDLPYLPQSPHRESQEVRYTGMSEYRHPVEILEQTEIPETGEGEIDMLITKLWFITKPSGVSTLADICFETDAVGLALQFRGGLEASDIVGMFDNESEAKHYANSLLEAKS